jgi:enterochelin esterase-like enzyme/sugar lactone lactonase YvrE
MIRLPHLLALSTLLSSAAPLLARDVPTLSDTAKPKPGVPEGKVETLRWTESKIFPNTERDGALYIPVQYQAGQPANFVVFLDGGSYLKKDGGARATIVLDNLIASKEIPVTAALFISPGTIPALLPGAKARSTRSFEYDTPNGDFVRYLAEEVLPGIRQKVNLRQDPASWAICGISSSGIAAFTAAWERPDLFGNVITGIGSFTNIRGGYNYPALIRASKKAPKPIRVWMQEGESDLDNLHGNWPLSNQDLDIALTWAGYEHHFAFTGGGHNGGISGALLPEALKWTFQTPVKTEPKESAKMESKPARHADAEPKAGVPEGKLVEMPVWKSTIFPNTERNWSVYVPAQYKNDGSAGVMIFQDGHDYQNRKGAWALPTVLDNLIAAGDLPPLIAVFINPGHDPAKPRKNPWSSSNRSDEYDGLGDRYARFLLEEILPEVEKQWPVSKNPEMRGLCGASSGGICAFTAAWERPDQFRRVLSTIGSFVNLRGGDVYPSLIRKTEAKPLRVFLQDSTGDLDNPFGHWPTANKQMYSALAYMGYDVKFDFEDGYGHNSHRGGAIFPDALRWLWRKEPSATAAKVKDDLAGDLTLNKLLIPGEGWQTLAEGLGFADGLSSDAQGNLFFNDLKAGGFWKLAIDGTRTKLSEDNGSGAKLAPDGRIVFCQGKKKQIAAMDLKTGATEVLAENVSPNDLVVTAQGWAFFTDTGKGEVVFVDVKTKTTRTAAANIVAPNGIALSPDGGTLAVSEYKGGNVWAFRIRADGTLDAGLRYMTLRRPIDNKGTFPFNAPPPYVAASGGDGMCTDAQGRYYVTSALGVQIFDPTGRECGLLPHPAQGKPLVSVAFAGPNGQWLCLAAGDRILRRKVQMAPQ